MKLALNLTREKLNRENYRFARQASASGIIAHLTSYNGAWSGATSQGVPITRGGDPIWNLDSLLSIKKEMAQEGLEWYGVENFDPGDWYDILLDGPKKNRQLDRIKYIIQNLGKAGIRYMGYNFSLTGVYGRKFEPLARGKAMTPHFLASDPDNDIPIPKGEVWNMVYDPDAPQGGQESISNEELWERCRFFLEQILPVAGEAGVILAAHPDDPPVPRLRQNARLIHTHDMFQKLIDLVPHPSNALELCIGTMAEMDANVYDAVTSFAQQGKIGYAHLRNVVGQVPDYYEVFVDEGDLDIFQVLTALKKGGYDGVLVPDHAPAMDCSAPWHCAMAYQMGYIKAAMQAAGVYEP